MLKSCIIYPRDYEENASYSTLMQEYFLKYEYNPLSIKINK